MIQCSTRRALSVLCTTALCTTALCATVSPFASLASAEESTAPAADAPVAILDGQVIRYSEFQPVVQSKLDALQHDYDVQSNELAKGLARSRAEFISSQAANYLDNRVLALEAKARKTTAAALVGALKVSEVTEAQMRAFYDSQRSQIGQPYEAVAARIRQFLQNEAGNKVKHDYFASLRAKYKASITLEPVREPVDAVGPQRGPDAAAVTIVEFSDFQCPFCGRLEPVLARIEKAYPSQVRLIYRNMPITSLHPDAGNAAAAAVCANQQGKFWPMHDVLFSEQSSLSVDALKEKAKRIGLDSGRFDACLDGGQARDSLKADETAAEKLGLSATPATFVNGRFVNGAISYDELAAIIEDELHRALTARR
jgi:protein-disulfide isomerase